MQQYVALLLNNRSKVAAIALALVIVLFIISKTQRVDRYGRDEQVKPAVINGENTEVFANGYQFKVCKSGLLWDSCVYTDHPFTRNGCQAYTDLNGKQHFMCGDSFLVRADRVSFVRLNDEVDRERAQKVEQERLQRQLQP